MSTSIGPKIAIEGEAEFKKAIAEINTTLKTMGTEMKAVTSAYDKNDQSAGKLTAQNEVLNKQIDAQKNKLAEIKDMLDKAAGAYGENDRQTQKLQQDYNLATASLNNMERQLKDNNAALSDSAKEVDNAGQAAENSAPKWSKLGDTLKASAAAMGAVVVAAGAAAMKLGTEVVKQFGELEQNLGGSEAVFGEYAKSIQKTGEEAYKNLGVSQSDYLATANKMGALFQGSGVEQQKSLELTEKAMQRAADMASVMGIDMQVALDSVAGAAKGNFTMMDNLGVAMNATNIEAYALSKGLDFTWKTATQAEKAEVAMQMFFENTEQYAGNFAREATQTVTGSIGLLKAALGSFTAGLGNTDADMKNLTENLVDAFQAVVENVVPIIQNLTAALPDALGAILPAIGLLLPDLMETVTVLFKQVLDTLLGLLPSLIPVAVDAVITIVDTLIDNLPMLIDGAFQLITALAEGLVEALPELVPKIVEVMIAVVNTIITNLPLIAGAALEIIVALAGGIIKSIPTLLASIPELVNSYVSAYAQYMGIIKDIGVNIVKGIWEGIASFKQWLKDKVETIAGWLPQWVKDKLGIHSPSRVFRDEVGKNIVLGIDEGIKDNEKKVIKTAGELSKHLLTEAQNWVEDKKFYNKLSMKDELEFWEDLKKMEGLQGEQLKDIDKKIYSAKQSIQKEENDATKNMLDEQQKAFDEYQRNLESRTESLKSFAGLFDKVEKDQDISGKELLSNLQSQVDAFKEWQSNIDDLAKKGITDELLSELRDMGPKSADEIRALTMLSDTELQKYVDLFSEKSKLAKEQAEKELGGFSFGTMDTTGIISDEDTQKLKTTATTVVDTLKIGISENMVKITEVATGTAENYTTAIQDKVKDFENAGRMMTDGLWQGIESGKSGLINNIIDMLKEAVRAAKDAMDINSPSKVWAEIGGFMAEGLGSGFVGEMRNVSKQINDSIPSNLSMAGGYSGGGTFGSAGRFANTTINDGGVNLYIANVNNSNDRNIQDMMRVAEFYRKQNNSGKGGV